MKGVLICGGSGTRLRPLTDITNKSLLPVYNKPLLEYPLQTLRHAGIKDVMVITGPEHIDQIKAFLGGTNVGEGSRFGPGTNFGSSERFGCSFQYIVQQKPDGIAQALGLAEDFAKGESVCAILGDNVFFDDLAPEISAFKKGGHVFLKEVPDAERFGVAEVDAAGKVVSIEEKPAKPKSKFAITGCYVYDNRCFDVIRNLKPSARGEYEITDVSRWYMNHGELTASVLQDEWVDAGTFESLHRAAVLARERQ